MIKSLCHWWLCTPWQQTQLLCDTGTVGAHCSGPAGPALLLLLLLRSHDQSVHQLHTH
jgi:hypothetical protein